MAHDSVSQARALARARAVVYGFLSTLLLYEPSKVLAQVGDLEPILKHLFGESAGAAHIAQGLTSTVDDDDLDLDYHNLFLVPGPSYVTPYASVYTDRAEDRGTLWGQETKAVLAFYRRADYPVVPGIAPDHLGLELDFMKFLCDREADFESDAQHAYQLRRLQREFSNDHLHWATQLCHVLHERAQTNFYRGVAKLIEQFLEMDRDLLSQDR